MIIFYKNLKWPPYNQSDINSISLDNPYSRLRKYLFSLIIKNNFFQRENLQVDNVQMARIYTLRFYIIHILKYMQGNPNPALVYFKVILI